MRRLRIKESDRLVTTTRELTALGAQVRIASDDLIIKVSMPSPARSRFAQRPSHRHDGRDRREPRHRRGVIHGAEAVNKSYPDFFDHYRLLGGKVTLEEE